MEQVPCCGVHGSGERAWLSFAEDFETTRRRDPQRPWDDKEYIAKDTYKLKFERSPGSPKVWAGGQERLAQLLPAIARDIAALLGAQADVRKVREAEEAVRKAAEEKRAADSRAWFASQKLVAERRAARQAQVGRAAAVGKAHDEFLCVQRLLAELAARTNADDISALEWLSLVRSQLADPIDSLIRDLRAEFSTDERPIWWPDPLPMGARYGGVLLLVVNRCGNRSGVPVRSAAK